MSNRLRELIDKRVIKLKEYNNTATTSWKKKLRRLELLTIENNIRIERLKRQFK
jgi:hypothetical protein